MVVTSWKLKKAVATGLGALNPKVSMLINASVLWEFWSERLVFD